MTIPSPEAHSPEQPPLTGLCEVLDAVAAYEDDRGIAPAIAHVVMRGIAYGDLIAQGADPETAAEETEIMHTDDEGETDRGLLELLHRDRLQAAGLALKSDAFLQRVLVVDAAKFYQTLDPTGLDEAGKVRAASTVGSYILATIALYQLEWMRSADTEVMAVLGDSFASFNGNLMTFGSEFNDTEVASTNSLLDIAPLLAERLNELGCDEQIGDELQFLAACKQEGDLIPWVVAKELGLIPTLNRESHGEFWHGWKTVQDWEPAFQLLQASNPAGQFRGRLAQNIRGLLTEQITVSRQQLAGSFEDYADQTMGWVEDEETGGIYSPPVSQSLLHEGYNHRRTHTMQHLAVLEAVLARFR
jgi:hypothetical protein